MPEEDFFEEMPERTNRRWPIITVLGAAALYLGVAHLKEWPPFPHKITQQDLREQKTYESLTAHNNRIAGMSASINSIDIRVRVMSGQHLGENPSLWATGEQNKLIDLKSQRAALVQNHNAEAHAYNAYMAAHGYPFTTLDATPVIVKHPVALPREIQDEDGS